jgi:hypothetical protein
MRTAPLPQFLRVIQVTTVQGTQTVSIAIDGTKNHSGTINAEQGKGRDQRLHRENRLGSPQSPVIRSAPEGIHGPYYVGDRRGTRQTR